MALSTKEADRNNNPGYLSDLDLAFIRMPVDEPFARSNNGKMPCKRGYLLDKDLKEESIETILSRMPQ